MFFIMVDTSRDLIFQKLIEEVAKMLWAMKASILRETFFSSLSFLNLVLFSLIHFKFFLHKFNMEFMIHLLSSWNLHDWT